jgi:hypothetical protein
MAGGHSQQPIQGPWLLIGYDKADVASLQMPGVLQEPRQGFWPAGAEAILKTVVAKVYQEVARRF